MADLKETDKIKEVDAELDIKKEIVPDEKTEMQLEVEKLRNENQTLRSDLGRVPALQSEITRMDAKISELLDTKMLVKDDIEPVIDDDDYVTGKRAKQLIVDAVKATKGEQAAEVEKVLTAREGVKTQYEKDYLKEVARLSIGITDDEALQGILNEMDTNFRDDSIKDPKVQARVNYADGKSSYLSKAMAAGKQIKFGSGKSPVAPLGGGNPGREKIIVKQEKEIAVPDDAKELLLSIEKDPEKRKALAREALA